MQPDFVSQRVLPCWSSFSVKSILYYYFVKMAANQPKSEKKYRIRHSGSVHIKIEHFKSINDLIAKIPLTQYGHAYNKFALEFSLSPKRFLISKERYAQIVSDGQSSDSSLGSFADCCRYDPPIDYLSLRVKILKKDRSEMPVKFRFSLLDSDCDRSLFKKSNITFTDSLTQTDIRLFKFKQLDCSFVHGANDHCDCCSNERMISECDCPGCTEYNESLNQKYCIISCEFHFLEEDQMSSDIGSLLGNTAFSDVVLVSAGTESQPAKEFPAHRVILAARSPVLAAMLSGNFKEREQDKVKLSENSEILKMLLDFIYTDNFEPVKSNALEIFEAADKYQLNSLKEKCASYLSVNLKIKTVAETLILADLHQSFNLKQPCIEFIRANFKKVSATEGWKILAAEQEDLVKEVGAKKMKKVK